MRDRRGKWRLDQNSILERAKDIITVIHMNELTVDNAVALSSIKEGIKEAVKNKNIDYKVVKLMITKGLIRTITGVDKIKYVYWNSPVLPNVKAMQMILNEAYQQVRDKDKQYRKANKEKDNVDKFDKKQRPTLLTPSSKVIVSSQDSGILIGSQSLFYPNQPSSVVSLERSQLPFQHQPTYKVGHGISFPNVIIHEQQLKDELSKLKTKFQQLLNAEVSFEVKIIKTQKLEI